MKLEAGFSLIEAIAATLIAVIAVLGLAYTFGVGRAQMDRFEVARAGLGVAKSRMEFLVLLAQTQVDSDSLVLGYRSAVTPFVYEGLAMGSSDWRVDPYDSPVIPGSVNMRRATVTVRWRSGSLTDSLQLDSLFPLQ